MIQNNFKIIVPVYNSFEYIGKNIISIINQSYQNFECIIIDDASTDSTGDTIINFFKNIQTDKKNKFKLYKRSSNLGAMANIVFGINSICTEKSNVSVTIDGDDFLASDYVLETLNEVYQDSNIWMTYGSYENVSNGLRGLCAPIPCDTKDYRKSGLWTTSHLRTFRKGLWDMIDDKDLRDASGKYYMTSWDRAFMYPLCELATNDRIKYIDKILYKYNDLNPINDFKRNLSLQLLVAEEIRNKPIYNKL